MRRAAWTLIVAGFRESSKGGAESTSASTYRGCSSDQSSAMSAPRLCPNNAQRRPPSPWRRVSIHRVTAFR